MGTPEDALKCRRCPWAPSHTLEEHTRTLEVTHHRGEAVHGPTFGGDPTETSAGKLVSRLARAVRPTAPQGS
jgi:hypothetical protein